MIVLGCFNHWLDVVCRHTPNISELAEKVYNLLLGINSNTTEQVPLKETGNKHRYKTLNVCARVYELKYQDQKNIQ